MAEDSRGTKKTWNKVGCDSGNISCYKRSSLAQFILHSIEEPCTNKKKQQTELRYVTCFLSGQSRNMISTTFWKATEQYRSTLTSIILFQLHKHTCKGVVHYCL